MTWGVPHDGRRGLQVYRGELLDGRAVAVKVQRPSVLGDICLDLYLLRLLTPLQTYASNWANGLATDPADVATGLALVDEWGRGFVQEVGTHTKTALGLIVLLSCFAAVVLFVCFGGGACAAST
jgi:hypothetical protein